MILRKTLFVALGCLLSAATSACMADVDAQREYSHNVAADLNRDIQAILEHGDRPPARSFCVTFADGACVFVRSPDPLPLCPPLQDMENCLAIELTSSLLDQPEVRALIEGGTADYCAYSRGTLGKGDYDVVRNFGCTRPNGFREYHHGHPTICVFGLNGDVIEASATQFAVQRGQRVTHHWCDKVT